jgi:hypothetical protein
VLTWREEEKKHEEETAAEKTKQKKHQIYAGRCSFQNRDASLFR